MTWIKLDTSVFRNRKVLRLTDAQQLAYIRLLAWAGESADDGYLPTHAIRAIPMSPKTAEALEAADLLIRNGNGWHIHDWDDHQGSLIERRRKDAERKRRERRKETE